MNEKNKHGSTSLHEACYAGHLDVVQTLLQHGANVATMTKRGYTSLHEASYAGHLEVVQTLLKHGANVATMNKDGKTSLHYACWQGHAAVVQTLLQHHRQHASDAAQGPRHHKAIARLQNTLSGAAVAYESSFQRH